MIGEILIIHFDHFKFSNSKFSQFSLNDNDTFHSVFHESIVTLMFLTIILKLNNFFDDFYVYGSHITFCDEKMSLF